jgi:hypothetical protein
MPNVKMAIPCGHGHTMIRYADASRSSTFTCGECKACLSALMKALRRLCKIDRRLVTQSRSPRIAHSMEYVCWRAMMRRCYRPSTKEFADYGAVGVRVCDRWHKFENFFADMCQRPSRGHSLDRYPNNRGHYEPGNVRWATYIEQSNNTKDNRRISHNGETHSLSEWARILDMRVSVLAGRLRSGWTFERAISVPVGSKRRSHKAA